MGISGRGRDGCCAMDEVSENLTLLRGVLLPSAHLLLDQRDKAELRACNRMDGWREEGGAAAAVWQL